MRSVSIILLGMIINLHLFGQSWKQNRIDININLPINHYFGDVGNSAGSGFVTSIKDFRLRALRGGFGGGISFKINSFITTQATVNTGFLGNTDDGAYYSSRGYRFSTFGSEIAAKGLYFIIPESNQNYYYSIMDLRGGLRHINKPFSLYVFLGVGGLFFNTSVNDAMLSRVPPDGSTKKEIDDSKHISLIIPFGIGCKYEFLPRFQFGAELGAKYSTTDYLDGFSSVNSKFNDMYYTLNLSIYYKIPYHKLLKKSFWRF
ncbi:DUF6089 family protein [Tenuifilum thalassicum]|uniref:DUF6089 domain-containing protein n=1 Tax=Tenuifilum thalassicum TaxID=2590900 RepID=A0A7D3XUF2_9BACT|nr:DUF6089 family protein [Tenuifilum thalassicum]QKG79008.1 hypothetical protein FHG85_01590 [Tenuifilum thalassicum]